MITILVLYVLFQIVTSKSYVMTDTDCIVLAIITHSITNEIVAYRKR